MRGVFLLATWCVVVLACAAQISDSGYIFTAPRTLKIGSPNDLQFLRFGDLNDEGVLKVGVYYYPFFYSNETVAFEKEYKIEKGTKESFFQMQLDPFSELYERSGTLNISGTIGDKEFSGSDKILFSTPKSKIIIIQTDKPLYQPGQEVQFRVLKLDKTLKPSGNKNDVADVYVEDPKGTRLFQFKNVDVGLGMKQMGFPLSEEPVLGSWKITVNSQNDTESTYFVVKKYVLPKFEVKIKFPSFVLTNAEYIVVEVCAKYTYGKKVKGELILTSSLETWRGRDKSPTLRDRIKLDGCYHYTMNVRSLEPENNQLFRRIKVEANFVEDGTGVQVNTTEYLQRTQIPLKLNFKSDSRQRQYYKPGLPYNGNLKVSHPDNAAAVNEPIEICSTIYRKRVIFQWAATRTVKLCKNYTSDDNGDVKYVIPPQNTDTTSITLEAKSLKYNGNRKRLGIRDRSLNSVETSMSLSSYNSPSGSFIQMETVQQPLPCGEQKSIRLLFTSKESADYKFHYQLIKDGEVVRTGTSEVSFTLEDDVSSKFSKENEVINESETQIDPPTDSSLTGSSSSLSAEDCPAAKEVRYIPPIGEAKINIDVDASLSPSFSLLVFYVRDDRETVADSQKIEVEKCFKNKVDFIFGDEVKQPATKTYVKVTASPNSLCGIKVVDKSISLLDSNDQLTASRVFQLLKSMNSNRNFGNSNPCSKPIPQPGLNGTIPTRYVTVSHGSYFSVSNQDALSAFQDSGFLVISDMILFTRSCPRYEDHGPYYPENYDHVDNLSFDRDYGGRKGGRRKQMTGYRRKVAYSRPAYRQRPSAYSPAAMDIDSPPPSVTKSAVEVRDYFPETWLFKMEMTGNDGIFVTKEMLPHTITEWVGNAACVSATDGLGISNSTSIKGFQAFFISYTLPISVIRGEEFWIVVSVFNYASGSLPIALSLEQPEGFQVTNGSIDGETCIQRDSNTNLKIKLKATDVGKVNITVRAETAPTSTVCGSSGVSNAIAKDAITKSLNVDAEGFPTEEVRSILFCPTDMENQLFSELFSLSLPEDVVPDSYRAYIDVTGNVMGPAMKNLNNLVALPTGCGEQNMVKFTPNYLVLDYLKDIGKLTDSVKDKAIRNLITGYQRELNYRHSDGSFSAFGKSDQSGSMFLTAFVLRSFHEAKRYITIDDSVLIQMQKWIVSKQAADGHFPNTGRIISHSLQSGIKEEGAITAYVLASLLISKYENETVINQAMSYLKGDTSHLTPYETFLYAYAEALGGDKEAAKNRLTQIKPRANTTGGMEFYNNQNGSKALNLETAAYAVLTNLKVGNSALEALPLIRYMTENLNPRGGFFSTQDTCVGLEALSKFANLVYKDPVDILVSIKGGLEDEMEVSEDNKLLVQRRKVTEVPSELKVEATGSGCGLIQTSLRYNTNTAPGKIKFNFLVNSKCITTDCKIRKISVAVSYTPEGKAAGMSVVDVKMISGTIPIKESLKKLRREKENNILRYDVESNRVIIYLAEVTNTGTQFSFEVEKVIEVENLQPATAKVYDYYAPEHSATTSYTNTEESSDFSSAFDDV